VLLEKTVKTKTAELNELNASKDRFFSIIAHDLKNPFTSIIGFSEMMNETGIQSNPVLLQEYSLKINESAVQTYRLLENLLEWANSQRGKLSFTLVAINLRELIRDEFAIVEEVAANKSIQLKNNVSDGLIIFADKNMLRTILRNLITNGIKFTRKNGEVQVNSVVIDGHVEISVTDNGIGISPEIIGRLFRIDANLATRGTENERGTGLGLFLCKEFVEKHGGKIWVESQVGVGSIFKFIIPLGLTNEELKN